MNLEKSRAQHKTLHRLITEMGESIEGEDVLTAIKEFYKQLYTMRGSIQKSFVDNLDFLQLEEKLKKELDNPLTLKELGKALFNLQNNHSPGEDGIPCDFYKVFWPKLKDFYFEVVKECVKDRQFHTSAR